MERDARRNSALYAALFILGLLLVSLLVPAFNGLAVTGFVNDKTYLMILQDNGEIRNTGGTISCMGLLTLHNGNAKSLQVWYASHAQTNADVTIDGSLSFAQFFGTNSLKLYDANVQYDFASYAPFLLSNYYNATGRNVDGVIAVDLTALREILRLTGPISVAGHVLTSRNVADLMYYYAAQSKDELVNLVTELGLKIAQIIRDASLPLKAAFVDAARGLVSEKHLQFYVPGSMLQHGLAGAGTPPEADFVSVVDYNLGSGKADPGIRRSIDAHVEIRANGSTVSHVTVTWTNENWWEYRVFTTVLIPVKAKFVSASHHSQTFEGSLVTRGSNFTALSALFFVPANKTCSVTYTYEQIRNVHGTGLGQHYDLYVQKQAGIDTYSLHAAVQLPGGATLIKSVNLGATQQSDGETHVQAVYM